MTQAQGSTLGADFAGRIEVRLSTHAGQVSGVDINNTRPRGVAKVFAGRTPDETLSMLGRVFSLCATAQTIAGLEAMEMACAVSVPEPQRAARSILREAEMLTQTVLRVCMDWPRLLGAAPAAWVARLALSTQVALEADLFGGQDWKVVGGALMRPDGTAARSRLSVLHGALKDILSADGFADQLLAALDARGLNGFGALADDAELETGALSRHWNDMHVVAARGAFGAGLRARLLARFADMRDLPASLLVTMENLGPCEGGFEPAHVNGEGKATVETARGALTHTVSVKDGKISAYTIYAPTDLNFLNDGVVAMGLMGAKCADLEALNTAAELHVLAVDPCVSCTLEIRDA